MKPRTLKLIAATVIVLAIGGGVFLQISSRQTRHVIARESVPPRPAALPGQPLQERVTACEQRIARGEKPVATLDELGRLYHANGYLTEAAQCYAGILRADPGNPGPAYRWASILAGFGQLDEAVVLLERVVRQAPEYAPAWIRLGDAFLKLNEKTKARAAFESALRESPGHPHASVGLARLAMQAGRDEEARQLLEPLVQQTNFAIGYDLLPTVYERLGEPEKAAALRGRAKASGAFADMVDPWIDQLMEDCYDTYRLSIAAGTAQHRGGNAGGLAMVHRAIGLEPENGSLHFQLGTMLLGTGDVMGAIRALERCVALKPDLADGWAYLVKIYAERGDEQTAQRYLAGGLMNCPRSPGLHLERGRRRAAAKQFESAESDFRTSIKLRPDEAPAYVDLARLYFAQERIDDGVSTLRAALQYEPDHPVVLTTLAMAYVLRGDEREATELLESVKRQPRVPPNDLQRLLDAFWRKFGRRPW